MLRAFVRRADYPLLKGMGPEILSAYLEHTGEQLQYPSPVSLTAAYLHTLYCAMADGKSIVEGRQAGQPLGEAFAKLPSDLDDMTLSRIIRDHPDVRPADWPRRLSQMLRSEIPRVRAQALGSLTPPANVPAHPARGDEAIRKLVRDCLTHRSDIVRAAALAVIHSAPMPADIEPVRHLQRTTKNQFLRGEAETLLQAHAGDQPGK